MGFKDESEIQIVNLKTDPSQMMDNIDHIHFFPAFHMNKKLWITIILDEITPWEKSAQLLDESYSLVNEKE